MLPSSLYKNTSMDAKMDSKNSPKYKVSVILPVYNCHRFVGSAIKSILNQTYPNLELIIINDGSTDESEQVIKSFTDSRIIYLSNEQNIGLINTLNKAISFATGDFIARMDADDIAHPLRIEKQLLFLTKTKHPSIVGCDILLIDKNNTIFKVPRTQLSTDKENHWAKYRKCPIHHPTVMFHRKILISSDPIYNIKDNHIEDYAAWMRLNANFSIYNINEYLLFYRVHGSSITSNHNDSQISNTVQMLKSYYFNLNNNTYSENCIKSILFLRVAGNRNFFECVNEIKRLFNDYSKIYGSNLSILSDFTYTILSISIRSNFYNFFFCAIICFKDFGTIPTISSFKKISLEFLNSFLFIFYYKIKYYKYLKNI